jgi:hypothetical protein
MSTKAEKFAFAPKMIKCLDSGDESLIEETFAQDFKMLVPGTGGRPSKDFPLPDGIAGSSFLLLQRLILQDPRHFSRLCIKDSVTSNGQFKR